MTIKSIENKIGAAFETSLLVATFHGVIQLPLSQCFWHWAMPLTETVPPVSRPLAHESSPPLRLSSNQAVYSWSDTAVGRPCAHHSILAELRPSAESPQQGSYSIWERCLVFANKDTQRSAVHLPGIWRVTPIPYSIGTRPRGTISVSFPTTGGTSLSAPRRV